MVTVGIPKGLLFPKYHVFTSAFFDELGAQTVSSPDTNKTILDLGTKYCVDDACLSIKVFHGHVAWLKDCCDFLFVPRIMGFKEREFICPMFCGLPEMLRHNITGLPHLIDTPLASLQNDKLYTWAKNVGYRITHDKTVIKRAFNRAMQEQSQFCPGINDTNYGQKIALLGHTYHIHDAFINMDLIQKMNDAGFGIITEEHVPASDKEAAVKRLFKKPFWSFFADYYGAAIHLYQTSAVDGFIYLSSFACGIDSILIELIKSETGEFPFLIIKLDEHTGEAGINTRLEAFLDLMKRRTHDDRYDSQPGEHQYCGKSVV